VKDNDADRVAPVAMLAELLEDNRALAAALKAAHDLCDQYGDVATASLLENWIDEAERRAWFLFETTRTDGGTPAIDGAGRQDTSGPSVQ
jgi:starvation-inducible DNA-binding protein